MIKTAVAGFVRYSVKKLMLCSALVLGFQLSVLASQTVSLAWDPSGEANVAGYVIHYGTQSGVYTNSVDVGNVTSASISVPADGSTYYFAATTYDSAGNTSAFSNETSYTTQAVIADALSQAGFANGQFGFNVSGVAGTQYVVLASTNLITWVPVQTNTAPFAFTDTNPGRFAQRFYRSVAL